MARFYVPPGTIRSEQIELGADVAKRISRVLRLNPGDTVTLFDGIGREFEVRITAITNGKVAATLVNQIETRPESAVAIHLCQALIRLPRFEWSLEKGTELGVATFVPVITERSLIRPHEQTPPRLERWRRIVAEAAEQCGRATVPEVQPPQQMALALVDAPGLKILLWEGAKEPSLKQVLRREPPLLEEISVSLFIGPEGGFTEQEVELAKRHGAIVASLGRRILRAETAGIVAAAAVMYELGGLE